MPAGQVWVHCGTGYRAAVAASLIERSDRTVVLIDDEFDNAAEHDLVAYHELGCNQRVTVSNETTTRTSTEMPSR